MASPGATSSVDNRDRDTRQQVSEKDRVPAQNPKGNETADMFRKLWLKVTDDNGLTLHGFRRFKTSHLLNLRFLEEDIAKVDHQIYQAGLKLGYKASPVDRLGLQHAKRDADAPDVEDVIDRELILRLRGLLKEYDEHLTAFNNIMLMETYALADNSWAAGLRSDLNAFETYKTRLVRVDQAHRSGSRDILRHGLRKCLRAFWFYLRYEGNETSTPRSYASASRIESNLKKSYQNTASLAEFLTRFLVALMAGAFLVVPLIVLSHQSSSQIHLITISVCIVIFCLLISLLSKASNEQIMAASAGYAAVLAVFLSNSSNGTK
ncbi:hypothetical protein ACLMJK_003241 [Lecanora helva]